MNIAYYDLGEGSTVLFLHGALLCAQTYQLTLATLAQNYRVIAPDVPGFGRSEMPDKPWDFQDYARFFVAFIEQLDLADITVIGHSFGGGIALALSVMTKRVTRRLLVNSAGIPYHCCKIRFLYLLFKEIITGPFRYKQIRPTLHCIKDLMRYGTTRPLDFFRIVSTLVKSSQMTYNFQNTNRIPTLVLHGTKDRIFPYDYAKQLHESIGASTFKTVQGDHGWCLYERTQLSAFVNTLYI